MVKGVTGSSNGLDPQPGDFSDGSIGQRMDEFSRCGNHVSPESIETLAVDIASALDQPGRINEVAGSLFVDKKRHSLFREPAGRTGVVEMNMRDKDPRQFFRPDSVLEQTGEKLLAGRFGTGLDEDMGPSPLHEISGDDAYPSLKLQIDDFYLHQAQIVRILRIGQLKLAVYP